MDVVYVINRKFSEPKFMDVILYVSLLRRLVHTILRIPQSFSKYSFNLNVSYFNEICSKHRKGKLYPSQKQIKLKQVAGCCSRFQSELANLGGFTQTLALNPEHSTYFSNTSCAKSAIYLF